MAMPLPRPSGTIARALYLATRVDVPEVGTVTVNLAARTLKFDLTLSTVYKPHLHHAVRAVPFFNRRRARRRVWDGIGCGTTITEQILVEHMTNHAPLLARWACLFLPEAGVVRFVKCLDTEREKEQPSARHRPATRHAD